MEKKSIGILTIIFVILLVFPTSQGGFLFPLKNSSPVDEKILIEPIVPKDDAFHGIQDHLTNEWWYFDAVFGNGYGIHVGVKVISFGGRWGVVNQLIHIYNHSIVEHQVSKLDLIDQYMISEEFPHISYQGDPLVLFDYDGYNKTGKMNYQISVQIDDIEVNLSFVQRTEGFKYITDYEGWTVAQPKATVQGTLIIDEQIIPVSGRGYHDHNWNFSLYTGLRSTGWYWGKITSANYTVTWAKILTTPLFTDQVVDNIAIISTIDEEFTHISPENIKFISEDMVFQNGRFIPTKFRFSVNQNDIKINVTFHAVSIQRAPPDFLTIHYWRYFVLVNGYIQKGGKRDYLDDKIQIIEFVRFI
jgi:hypothetical protein